MYSEKRDYLFDPVMNNIRSMGQYLKGLFVSNPKELGDWGYTVDDSPRAARKRSTTIAPDSIRLLKGIKRNCLLENTGTIDLRLHRGRKAGTEAVTLTPGNSHIITWGWGTLTVKNEDNTREGEVSYTTPRI